MIAGASYWPWAVAQNYSVGDVRDERGSTLGPLIGLPLLAAGAALAIPGAVLLALAGPRVEVEVPAMADAGPRPPSRAVAIAPLIAPLGQRGAVAGLVLTF